MRRAVCSLLIAISICVSGFLDPANAATPKIGATCTKLNSTASIAKTSDKLICAKVGKVLIWKKIQAKPMVMPSSPTPGTAPNSPTPSTSPSPVVHKPVTSFEDLLVHPRDIAYSAWLKASQQIAEGTSILGDIRIAVGPNTTPTNKDPLKAMSSTSKLYSKFTQPKVVHDIEYVQQDIPWANEQYKKIQDQTWRSNFATVVADECPTVICKNAMAQINNSNEGILLIGEYAGFTASESVGNAMGHFDGSLEAHEYTHTIQMINTPAFTYSMAPSWWMEGMATWSGQAAASTNFSNYEKLRMNDVRDLYANPSAFSAEWIEKYLNPKPVFVAEADNWGYWRSYENYRIYDVGSLAIEALVALQGPDSVMNMYVKIGQKIPFEDTFKEIYGISWAEADTYLAKAISYELQRG